MSISNRRNPVRYILEESVTESTTFQVVKGGVTFALVFHLNWLPEDHVHFNRWCIVDLRSDPNGVQHSIQETFLDAKDVIKEEFVN